jgi:serine/threonine protein kinase
MGGDISKEVANQTLALQKLYKKNFDGKICKVGVKNGKTETNPSKKIILAHTILL